MIAYQRHIRVGMALVRRVEVEKHFLIKMGDAIPMMILKENDFLEILVVREVMPLHHRITMKNEGKIGSIRRFLEFHWKIYKRFSSVSLYLKIQSIRAGAVNLPTMSRTAHKQTNTQTRTFHSRLGRFGDAFLLLRNISKMLMLHSPISCGASNWMEKYNFDAIWKERRIQTTTTKTVHIQFIIFSSIE